MFMGKDWQLEQARNSWVSRPTQNGRNAGFSIVVAGLHAEKQHVSVTPAHTVLQECNSNLQCYCCKLVAFIVREQKRRKTRYKREAKKEMPVSCGTLKMIKMAKLNGNER